MHQHHQSFPNSPKAKTPPVDLAQASSFSLERDCSSNVGHFYMKLAQESPLAPKREVIEAQQIRLNRRLDAQPWTSVCKIERKTPLSEIIIQLRE